ncbi:hypothetical protein HCA58_12805 [Micromonospora sp. HNM0581]|uniref:hypothetical protein n=1 Tax=Micromonospora sp. HNM0581 TaxID=2716341 RepID=UPI00146A5A76|nr:hypothetical protein [Micromonospora sp. HNM0581]NLU79242.1 hypothetical protein [Micromonospora sp. HNM0581]
MTEARIGWAAPERRLVDAATADRAWYRVAARELAATGDRLAGGVGCGAVDPQTWDRLPERSDPVWLGDRRDVLLREARGVHAGRRG